MPSNKQREVDEWLSSLRSVDKVHGYYIKGTDGDLVHVDLTCEQMKSSPEYDPLTPVNRGYEEHLYDYYGIERYWLP